MGAVDFTGIWWVLSWSTPDEIRSGPSRPFQSVRSGHSIPVHSIPFHPFHSMTTRSTTAWAVATPLVSSWFREITQSGSSHSLSRIAENQPRIGICSFVALASLAIPKGGLVIVA